MRALLWAVENRPFSFPFSRSPSRTPNRSASASFLDTVWQAPLIIVLLAFFVAGAALAVLSLLGSRVWSAAEVARLKRNCSRKLAGVQAGSASPEPAPFATFAASLIFAPAGNCS
jgi:putative membrane protein